MKSNDKNKENFALSISGDVERFATISPSRVKLKGRADETLVTTVRIIPEKAYPFEIVSLKLKNVKHIKSEYKKIQGPKGPEYLITITNLKKDAGRYRDYIMVKTNSNVKPEMRINVSGDIREVKNNDKSS